MKIVDNVDFLAPVKYNKLRKEVYIWTNITMKSSRLNYNLRQSHSAESNLYNPNFHQSLQYEPSHSYLLKCRCGVQRKKC